MEIITTGMVRGRVSQRRKERWASASASAADTTAYVTALHSSRAGKCAGRRPIMASLGPEHDSATFGLGAGPRAGVATLVAVGAAGPTWANLARRVAAWFCSGFRQGYNLRFSPATRLRLLCDALPSAAFHQRPLLGNRLR